MSTHKNITMKIKLLTALLVAIGMLVANIAFAQQKEIREVKDIDVVGFPKFQAELRVKDQKLDKVEAVLGRVESAKVITERDSEDLGKTMYEYAEGMKKAFDTAIREATVAAKSKGKKGDVRLLEEFEKTTKTHEIRLKQIEAQTKRIEANLKTGAIKPDKSLLQKMTPQEIREFKKFLAPEGIREMEKLHPGLFKDVPTKSLAPSEDTWLSSLDSLCCYSLAEKIGNFIVAPAEASIAAPCILPCLAMKWSECLTCLKRVVPAGTQAWDDFTRCWRGCKWYKPWCYPGCVGKLILKLG